MTGIETMFGRRAENAERENEMGRKKTKMPARIKVGHMVYKVEPCETMSGLLLGEIDYEKQTIQIKTSVASDIQRETLVHELIHSVLLHTGELDKNNDEPFVMRLAAALTTVIRENPQLMNFLRE